MTTYVGASPETVEAAVTQPVEAAMATVSNIESISSVSNENYSMVILEFAQTADMNAVSLEIRESLDQIKSYWNDSIGNPILEIMSAPSCLSTSEICDALKTAHAQPCIRRGFHAQMQKFMYKQFLSIFFRKMYVNKGNLSIL